MESTALLFLLYTIISFCHLSSSSSEFTNTLVVLVIDAQDQVTDYNLYYSFCTDLHLQVITVATDKTDGCKRFINSANHHGINVEVCMMI